MNLIKRFFDILLSLFLLVLLFPVLILICILLYFFQKKIFFTQKRIGYKNKDFVILKFKTMNDNIGENDIKRTTKIGKILRSTSLDELPSLYNVLIGNMSFVGPRPLLPEYLEFYSLSEIQRHNMRPGITGLAQVKGRNKISWRNRLKYDVFYVKKFSFFFDLYIIFYTLKYIFKFDHINYNKSETMISFIDYKKNEKK